MVMFDCLYHLGVSLGKCDCDLVWWMSTELLVGVPISPDEVGLLELEMTFWISWRSLGECSEGQVTILFSVCSKGSDVFGLPSRRSWIEFGV